MTDFKQTSLEKSALPRQNNGGFQDSPNVLRLDKTLNIKNQVIINDKELVNKGGNMFARIAFSSSTGNSVFTVAVSDFLVGITSLADSPSIGLPRPKEVGPGKHYIVKDEAGGAGTTTITIRSMGEETIDGASSSTLTTNYEAKEFYTDGVNWFIK